MGTCSESCNKIPQYTLIPSHLPHTSSPDLRRYLSKSSDRFWFPFSFSYPLSPFSLTPVALFAFPLINIVETKAPSIGHLVCTWFEQEISEMKPGSTLDAILGWGWLLVAKRHLLQRGTQLLDSAVPTSPGKPSQIFCPPSFWVALGSCPTVEGVVGGPGCREFFYSTKREIEESLGKPSGKAFLFSFIAIHNSL